MLKRLFLSTIVMLAVVAAPASAQVSLQWKFKEGEKFFLETKTVNKMTTKVMGQAIEQSQAMTQVMEVHVKKVTREGMVVETKVDSLSSKVEMLGKSVDVGEDVDAMFKGVTYTLTMTPDGKVTKFEGYDQFLKNLDGLAAQTDDETKKLTYTMMKQMLTEEAMKASYASIFDILPSDPVKVGEKWKREQRMPMGPIGSLKLDLDYTYKGPADANTEKIDFKASVSHEPAKGDAGGAMFKISKADFGKTNVEGQVLFDKKTHRLGSLQQNVTLGGQMTLDIGGMEITADMEGTVVNTTRVLEKRPAKD